MTLTTLDGEDGFVDQDGTRRRATEQEREQQLAKTREYLDKNCR